MGTAIKSDSSVLILTAAARAQALRRTPATLTLVPVLAEAADTIDALLDEVERLKGERNAAWTIEGIRLHNARPGALQVPA